MIDSKLTLGGQMKKHLGLIRDIGISLLTMGALLGVLLFGTSILNNLHLRYLRVLSRNTVLLHNSHRSGASGFIVKGKSGKLYVMTNNHVCELEEQIGTTKGIFVLYQGRDYFLRVVKRYKNNDLCAVEAPETAMLPALIASSVTLGESAYAIGHPQLEPLSISVGELSDLIEVTVEAGRNVDPKDCSGPGYELISVENGKLNPFALIFGIHNVCVRSMPANTSSIIISPGNSGSPVVNIYGSVIGVIFAANEHGTRSYAVPLSDLKQFLGEL
jgi:S1-C subfamily serine protease